MVTNRRIYLNNQRQRIVFDFNGMTMENDNEHFILFLSNQHDKQEISLKNQDNEQFLHLLDILAYMASLPEQAPQQEADSKIL